MKKLYLLIFGLLMSFSVFGQTGKVTGVLWDSLMYQPVQSATVTVFRLADSSIMNFSFSENDGHFTIEKLPVDVPLRLLVSHINYASKRIDFTLKQELLEKNFDSLLFAFKVFEIEAVEISWEKPPIMFQGDTISFQADAFLKRPGTVVEDLLKRLPGIEFGENGITMNGQNVSRILLDGREFFGSDPTLLLKNIPAMMVDKVEVTNEKNEFGKLTKKGNVTINVTLKPEAKKGSFGKAFAGFGTTSKYENGLMWNVFRDTLQISFIGYANNLSKSGFSYSDLYKLGGFNRQNIRSITYSDNTIAIGNTSFGGGQGLTTSYGGGVNLSHIIFKKINFNASYFYGAVNTEYLNSGRKDYLFTDSTLSSAMNGEKYSNGYNHSFKIGANGVINEKSSFYFEESGVLGWEKENSLQQILNTRNILDSSQITNDLFSRGNIYNIDGYMSSHHDLFDWMGFSLSYKHKLKKGSSNNTYSQMSLAQRVIFDEQSFDQIGNDITLNNNHEAYAYFEFEWNDYLSSDLTYSFENQTNQIIKETSQQGSSDIEFARIPMISGLFDYNYQRHSLSKYIEWDFSSENSRSIDAEFGYEFYNVISREKDRGLNKKSRFYRPIGNVGFNYNDSDWKNYIMIELSQELEMPSVSQLIPILDNLNPMLVNTGNYLLEPTYTTNLYVSMTKELSKSGLRFRLYSNTDLSQNPVMRNTYYDEIGREINTFENIDDKQDFSSYQSLTTSKTIKISEKWDMPLSVLFQNSLGKSYQSLYGELNEIFYNSFWVAPRITVIKKDVFELGCYYSRYWKQNDADLVQQISKNISHSFGSTFWLQLPKGFSIEYDYKLNYQPFITSGIDNAVNLLSLSINKRIFKDDKGIIKLSVFDLLKQNKSISRTVTENYISESESNTVVRYVMMSFVYNLNTLSAKEKSKTRGEQLFWW